MKANSARDVAERICNTPIGLGEGGKYPTIIQLITAELEKRDKRIEKLREACTVDQEYYEAKPHKCLEILDRLKAALKADEGDV